MVDEHLGPAVPLGAGDRHGFENGIEVVADAEALEDAGFLGEVTHAEACAFVHGQFGNIASLEDYSAVVGCDHTHYHSKGGGFSRAVSSEQTDNAALGDGNGYFVYDRPAGIFFYQAASFKKYIVH
jgi:hypothetical protein